MTAAATRPAIGSPPGWQARLDLQLAPHGERTVLTHRMQRGPLAVQRPFYPEGEVCHLYVLHPPGGVVGGDRLEITAAVAKGGWALLTTPGATKVYRSGGPTARVTQQLVVDEGGALEWLPQETIVFDGGRVAQRTRIELADGGVCIAWDILCLGRPAIAERFERGQADLSLEIWRAGTPLLIERLRAGEGLGGDGPARLRSHAVLATLVAAPAGRDALERARAAARTPEGQQGCTLVDGLLVVRWLGDDAAAARRDLRAVWERLRPSVAGRPACPPRIWAT